jgi:hypothetical protein
MLCRMRKLGVLALALISTAPSSQNTPSAPQERGAGLMTITFAATDKAGVPIADLRREEVSIRVDGRPREVRSLQFVAIAAGSGVAAAQVPPPFASNNVAESGRTVALIIDDESFAPGGEVPLRRAVDRLLNRLNPSDRAMLVTIPHGGVRIPPTTEHGRIATAVATLSGRGQSTQSGSDFACRTRDTLLALTNQLHTLPVFEPPSIVFFVTAGVAPPRRDASVTTAPGMCELLLDTFREVGAAAGRSRAHFYLVPPVDIMSTGTIVRENIAGAGARGSDNPMEGIEHLLGATGGKMLNLGGETQTAFDRGLAENAGYYVATIDPQRSDRGRPHALNVRATRANAEIRSGHSITFPDTDAPGSRPSKPSPRDMLSTTEVFRGLPMRAAAFSSVEPSSDQIRIVALVEPVEPGTALTALMAAVFDRDGKGVASWVAQAADLQRAPMVGAMAVPPGSYRMRVAAIDSNGRTGTVDHEVDVELARTGPLKISSILLGLSRSGAFVPRMQFTTEPVVIGYMEMAGAPAGAKVVATLELADAPNAPARLTVPLTIEAGAGGRYVAKGALPIGALPPGDYSVRATVALDAHPPTRVVRTLRKATP